MGAIDVGSPAINRAATIGANGTTDINYTNSANDSGVLNTFEVYAASGLTSFKMGTFYGSGSSFTYRDYESLGSVSAGSKQTFSGLNCDVSTGDYIGGYSTTGTYECDSTGGSGVYYVSGDKFSGGAASYSYYGSFNVSLYATGETASGMPLSFDYHFNNMRP